MNKELLFLTKIMELEDVHLEDVHIVFLLPPT